MKSALDGTTVGGNCSPEDSHVVMVVTDNIFPCLLGHGVPGRVAWHDVVTSAHRRPHLPI